MTNQEFVNALLDLQERINRKMMQIVRYDELPDADWMELVQLSQDYIAAERLANSDWLNPPTKREDGQIYPAHGMRSKKPIHYVGDGCEPEHSLVIGTRRPTRHKG